MGFSVKDMAWFFDNTKGAIRFYEEKGLLAPERDASGHRTYTERDLFQLFYLRRYGEFGCSLAEINRYFRSDNGNRPEEICEFLKEKEAVLEQQLQHIRRMKRWAEDYRREMEEYLADSEKCTELEVEGYYYLNADYFCADFPERRDIIKAWILAAPMTHIHIVPRVDLRGRLMGVSGIGIEKRLAQEIGLEIPPEAVKEPAGQLVSCMLKLSGKNFEVDYTEAIAEKRQWLEERGYRIEDTSHISLQFSNQMQGVEHKYYRIFFRKQN